MEKEVQPGRECCFQLCDLVLWPRALDSPASVLCSALTNDDSYSAGCKVVRETPVDLNTMATLSILCCKSNSEELP